MHTEENLYAFFAFMAVLYLIWHKVSMALTNNNEFNIAGNKAKIPKAVEKFAPWDHSIKGYDIKFILLSFQVFPLF